MRKVINGKLYDTETAEVITGRTNGYTSNDLNYECENLYRSQKGTYFMHYQGGPLSRYARQYGNGAIGEEGINVLTEEEARNWAMKCMEADDYIEVFGAVEEG